MKAKSSISLSNFISLASLSVTCNSPLVGDKVNLDETPDLEGFVICESCVDSSGISHPLKQNLSSCSFVNSKGKSVSIKFSGAQVLKRTSPPL